MCVYGVAFTIYRCWMHVLGVDHIEQAEGFNPRISERPIVRGVRHLQGKLTP